MAASLYKPGRYATTDDGMATSNTDEVLKVQMDRF